MTRFGFCSALAALAAVFFTVALVGCGGGSGSPSAGIDTQTRYVGFFNASATETGDVALNVAADGTVSGQVAIPNSARTRAAGAFLVTLSGTSAADGSFTAQGQGTSPAGVAVTIVASGKIPKTDLSTNLSVSLNGVAHTGLLSLRNVASPSPSPTPASDKTYSTFPINLDIPHGAYGNLVLTVAKSGSVSGNFHIHQAISYDVSNNYDVAMTGGMSATDFHVSGSFADVEKSGAAHQVEIKGTLTIGGTPGTFTIAIDGAEQNTGSFLPNF